MFCNTCGAQLEDNVSFCTQCGAPVQNIETPVYAPIDDHPTELFSEEPVAEVTPAYEATPAYTPAEEQATELISEVPAYEAPVYENTASESQEANVSPKSRKTALILSILLGYLGISRLYLGAKGGVSRLIMYIIGMVCSAAAAYVPPLFIVALPLIIICMVGGIKDIIRSAKGTMVDKDGLPVTKW
ncbi:MAG: TM2 domain-containing protein [Ruminococcaceae bacterium]|nr:TM2 domain-containing protein [Oscillospiraceae bacterium]